LDSLGLLLVRQQAEDDPKASGPDRLVLVKIDLAAVAEVADPRVVVERLAVAERLVAEPRKKPSNRPEQRRR